ncbi:MAG: heavy-metal-associated domain-containing protein [Planctomycetes bacterium]|nr:heavy-metal-associated domain-containing protein [Planctomycetota bacterium]
MRTLLFTLLVALLPVACGDSGNDARVTTTAPVALRFQVDGMHCGGCVDAITDKVKRVDGVVDCRVSLDQRQADVAVREPQSRAAVQKAIEGLGYKVTPLPTPAAGT